MVVGSGYPGHGRPIIYRLTEMAPGDTTVGSTPISRNVIPWDRARFNAGKMGARTGERQEIPVVRHDFPQSFTHFQPLRDKVLRTHYLWENFGQITGSLPYISARLGLHPHIGIDKQVA